MADDASTAQAGTMTDEELEKQRAEFEAEQAGGSTEGGTDTAAQEAGETEEQKKEREAKELEQAEGEVKKLSPKAQEHVNKKIGRLVAETKAEREARFKIELEAAELRGRLKAYEEQGRKPAETGDPDKPQKPNRDDFDSDESYLDARDEFTKKELLRELQHTTKVETAAERANAEVQKTVADTLKIGREKYKDFDTVTSAENLKWSPEMMTASIESGPEISAELGYYFGKHPEEVERIKSLPVHRQFMEVGAVKAAIVQTHKKSTNAPPPVSAARSGGATTEISLFNKSDAELAKELRERAAAKNR